MSKRTLILLVALSVLLTNTAGIVLLVKAHQGENRSNPSNTTIPAAEGQGLPGMLYPGTYPGPYPDPYPIFLPVITKGGS